MQADLVWPTLCTHPRCGNIGDVEHAVRRGVCKYPNLVQCIGGMRTVPWAAGLADLDGRAARACRRKEQLQVKRTRSTRRPRVRVTVWHAHLTICNRAVQLANRMLHL